MTLRIGTSGWSYPSGAGTWNGVFYPSRRGRRARFDELAYYAERFDTVEVNTTFYRIPPLSMTQSWARRTPSGFEFSLKLFRGFTHGQKKGSGTFFEGKSVKNVPDPFFSQADIDAFRAAIEPIANAGRFGALLAQFPPSFKSTPENRDHVERLLRAFREYPVAVELRHRSWSDEVAGTLTLLNAHGAAWTQIDEPKFRFSIRQNYLPNVTGFYYMRLHGRNAAMWWRHEKSEDRYDYLYSDEELQPFVDTADAVRRLVKKLYLYTNNHFSAKSVANAISLKKKLGLPTPGQYPPEFVRRYPHLADVATTSAPLLHTSS